MKGSAFTLRDEDDLSNRSKPFKKQSPEAQFRVGVSQPRNDAPPAKASGSSGRRLRRALGEALDASGQRQIEAKEGRKSAIKG
jgi:hypothetical protein